MPDPSAHHWHRRRFTLALATGVVNRLTVPLPVSAEVCEPELPGPDGIRHELVARIRREIAAGTYDTEEKWLAAEAEILRRVEDGM